MKKKYTPNSKCSREFDLADQDKLDVLKQGANMSSNLEKIINEALTLPEIDRAYLADRLLSSLGIDEEMMLATAKEVRKATTKAKDSLEKGLANAEKVLNEIRRE